MGRSHLVRGGHQAPAPTALWGAMDVTPRPVPPRITADQVLASYTEYIARVCISEVLKDHIPHESCKILHSLFL